jgi:hypothetical protein
MITSSASTGVAGIMVRTAAAPSKAMNFRIILPLSITAARARGLTGVCERLRRLIRHLPNVYQQWIYYKTVPHRDERSAGQSR